MASELQQALLASKGAACACASIRQVARAVTQLYDDALRPVGLRATQFSILGATLGMEPATVNRLAEATVTDRTTLTRNLKLLEREGLVRIRIGSDRRERDVSLTTRGREAFQKALPLWERAQRQVLEGVGPKRWQALRRELQAVVAVARRK